MRSKVVKDQQWQISNYLQYFGKNGLNLFRTFFEFSHLVHE